MTAADEGTDAEGTADAVTRTHRAAALKERIYVAFTTLAVVLALRTHEEPPTSAGALGVLTIAVAATVCAVYVADLLSHMVVHAHLPAAAEHRRIVADTLGAGAVALPSVACLALAAGGVVSTSTGLLAAMVVTVVTLAAVGLLAVRRLAVPRRLRVVILLAEALLGVVVLALGLLAHR